MWAEVGEVNNDMCSWNSCDRFKEGESKGEEYAEGEVQIIQEEFWKTKRNNLSIADNSNRKGWYVVSLQKYKCVFPLVDMAWKIGLDWRFVAIN